LTPAAVISAYVLAIETVDIESRQASSTVQVTGLMTSGYCPAQANRGAQKTTMDNPKKRLQN